MRNTQMYMIFMKKDAELQAEIKKIRERKELKKIRKVKEVVDNYKFIE